MIEGPEREHAIREAAMSAIAEHFEHFPGSAAAQNLQANNPELDEDEARESADLARSILADLYVHRLRLDTQLDAARRSPLRPHSR